MDARPAPSTEKLLTQFRDWLSGDELPGRTMSYLKTGFLDDLLTEAETNEAIETMLEHWGRWESGDTNPEAVLETLRDNGLEAFLAG